MYRIDDATAAASLPTPESAAAEGYFTEGNPATGTLATKVRASWLNMLQEELRNVVTTAGLTPSKTNYTQVASAVQTLIAKAAQGINSTGKINGVNAANLLFNGSGEFGVVGWFSVIGSGLVAVTDADGGGTYLSNGNAISGSTFAFSSPPIPALNTGTNVTLSLEGYAVGATAGSVYARISFLDSNLNAISFGPSIPFTRGASWTIGAITASVPAGIAYMSVQIVADTSPTASVGGVRFRRIKLERGITPSLYSQEASIATVGGGMPVIGTARNVAMSVATASATATLTADEIIVCSALGGVAYKLDNFNQTINLATTGAGGVDAGSAPVSGFVVLYAIYNPTTKARALLARNATSAVQPNFYSGGNMPAGYTASALVSVWQTTSGGLFNVGSQFDRVVSTPGFTVLSTTTQAGSYTSFSISGGVPPNAKTARGYQSITGNTASAGLSSSIAGSASGIGAAGQAATMPTNSASVTTPFPHVPLVTSQTLYYLAAASSGTLTFVVGVYEYTF